MSTRNETTACLCHMSEHRVTVPKPTNEAGANGPGESACTSALRTHPIFNEADGSCIDPSDSDRIRLLGCVSNMSKKGKYRTRAL